METRFNALNQLETLYKYSAYLKGSLKALTIKDLEARLLSLKDEHFDQVISYEYNSIGQVIAQKTGGQRVTTFEYNAFGEQESSTLVRDADHHIMTYFGYDRRGLLSEKIDDKGGLNRKTTIGYDAFGWIKNQTILFNSMDYVVNNRGERITLFTATGQFKDFTYDAFGRILSETDYNQITIREYTYDDSLNQFFIKEALYQTQLCTQLDAFGDKISYTDAKGYITTFEYNEQSQLIQVNGPENASKKYHYDDNGQLTWQEDAGGHHIEYTYDAEGHVLSQITDPEGLAIKTQYRYDALGRQLSITDSNGHIKEFTYDNQGNLIRSCVDPDGLNLITEFTYDDRGLLIRQTVLNTNGSNKVIAYEWDSLGRRTATIVDPDGLKLKTSYEYDANDNLICQTDANQRSTHFIYDKNNKCRYQIDARGVVTEHRYTSNGDEKHTIKYANRISSLTDYTEDTLQKVLITDELFDQHQFRLFDEAGRLDLTYNSLGYATGYSYDENNNIIKITRYAKAVSLRELKQGSWPKPDASNARVQILAYDGQNRVRYQADNNGHTTMFQYDAHGQLIARTECIRNITLSTESTYSLEHFEKYLLLDAQYDKTTRYAYDQVGRLSIEISPRGAVTSYQYDGIGHIISCTRYAKLANSDLLLSMNPDTLSSSTQDRTNYFIYDAAGRERYRISAEGWIVERCYDDADNVIKQITHNQRMLHASYSIDALNTLLSNDTDARASTYTFDAAGRVTNEVNAKKQETAYSYDNEGNLLTKTQANHAIWSYVYDEANQLIEIHSPITRFKSNKGIEERSIITMNTYDSFGNLITEVRDATGLKQTRNYAYDALNQRTQIIYPQSRVNNASKIASNKFQDVLCELTEQTRYNAFGEIIASSDKATNWKHFAYDDLGHLIYSIDTRGAVTKHDYDPFGRIMKTTRYERSVVLKPTSEYSKLEIDLSCRASEKDRHQIFVYDLDDHLIEQTSDSVRSYNARTGLYQMSTPRTQITYNAFGEAIKNAVLLHESTPSSVEEWANTTIYYSKDGQKTAQIDAEGYLTRYTLNNFGEVDDLIEYAVRIESWDNDSYSEPQKNNKDRSIHFTYDALGQVISKTINQVSVTSIDKNNKGQLNTEVRNLSTRYIYDALGNLVETVDAKGNHAYCYYDQQGQLIAKITPVTKTGLGATTYTYDALGNLVETHQWANGAKSADIEEYQLNTESTNDIIHNSGYDIQGLLQYETDGKGHKVFYSYDANGNIARRFQTVTRVNQTDSFIQDIRYTYDSENHLICTTYFKNNGTLRTEDAQYNFFGEMTDKGVNRVYNIHISYDEAGRAWRSNAQGYYQIYIYDLANQVTQIITASNGFHPFSEEKGIDLSEQRFEVELSLDKEDLYYRLQRQNSTYDAVGHLLKQTKEYTLRSLDKKDLGEHKTATQEQNVDRWGNMLTYTDSLGHVTRYEYNELNAVTLKELPQVSFMNEHGVLSTINPTNHYYYDELGQLIALVDANGHMTTKDYDALGNIIEETDAKQRSRYKHYNVLNQMDYVINEREAVTIYFYDKNNRLEKIVTPQTEQSYVYDELGALLKQTNTAGDTQTFEYDNLGNQTKRTNAQNKTTTYAYDDYGHKTLEIDPLSHQKSWIYDADGRLQSHTDMGNRVTTYKYNTNGLVIEEHSSAGKHIYYNYQGDGLLVQYDDRTRSEVMNYTYDTEGQMLSKESSKAGDAHDGWMREKDFYSYDELGRLVDIQRRRPEDIDSRTPNKNRDLLSIHYDYDKVGNIRHTKVSANYTGYNWTTSDDYFLYDENDRITVNKGQLVNGSITITNTQGTELAYDEVGNISDAVRHETGRNRSYHYVYDLDNRVSIITKDKVRLQTKTYKKGLLSEDKLFNADDICAQTTEYKYIQGELTEQILKGLGGALTSITNYQYNDDGSLKNWEMKLHGGSSTKGGETIIHEYSYEYWDTYQQKTDSITRSAYNAKTTKGHSTRTYDIWDGLLTDSVDEYGDQKTPDAIHYWSSAIEGIRARENKTTKINYLNVGGNVIGDLQLDAQGQHLNIYGGFTPAGRHRRSWGSFNKEVLGEEEVKANQRNEQIQPEIPDNNAGTYTVQAGDSLEDIALQVYGDSSLWYLIADANGLSDRQAIAGNDGPLYIGQRLTLPSAAGQHHTSNTHRVLDADHFIGNTTATAAVPITLKPPKPKHHSLWSKVLVGIVAVVATVLTAGALSGGMAALSTMFQAGITALGGGVAGSTMGAVMATGFAAGFVGSIASQGVANMLGLQHGMDFTGALISGLASAATAGIGKATTGMSAFKKAATWLDTYKFDNFSISSAAITLEQNAASQTINLARRHQHFDWISLGVAGLTGGYLGSKNGLKFAESLGKYDHNTGLINSQLQASVNAGIGTITTGESFVQTIGDGLGSSIGNAISNGFASTAVNPLGIPDGFVEAMQPLADTVNELSIDGLMGDYGKIKQEFNTYLAQISLNELFGPNSINEEKKHDPISDKANFNNIADKEFHPYSSIKENSLDQLIKNVDGEICYPQCIKESENLVTREQLSSMFPSARKETLDAYLPELNSQLAKAGINTEKELAFFFATIEVETDGMTDFVENCFKFKNPKASFPQTFKNMSIKEIRALGQGELFANTIYAHKNGNGDVKSGDGYRYRGRGLFHYTGKGNYQMLGGEAFVKHPDSFLTPPTDVELAIKFWKRHNISKTTSSFNNNNLSSAQRANDIHFRSAVLIINGGYNGLARRANSYNRYIQILKKS